MFYEALNKNGENMRHITVMQHILMDGMYLFVESDAFLSSGEEVIIGATGLRNSLLQEFVSTLLPKFMTTSSGNTIY